MESEFYNEFEGIPPRKRSKPNNVVKVYPSPGIPMTFLTPTGVVKIVPEQTRANSNALSSRESMMSIRIEDSNEELTPMPSTSKDIREEQLDPQFHEVEIDGISFHDHESLLKVIQNMNLARQIGVPLNDFNLEKIYKTPQTPLEFLTLRHLDIIEEIYPEEGIVFPSIREDILFSIIIEVFYNEINCGYFEDDELDFIFSTLTLNQGAQTLLSEVMKKPLSWLRIESNSENELFVQELINGWFLHLDLRSEEVTELMKMLKDDELQNLCKLLRVGNRSKSRNSFFQKLMEYGKRKTSSSNERSLHAEVIKALGCCVHLTPRAKSIFDRVFTLLQPCQNPSETNADIFLMLDRVQKKQIMFPKTQQKQYPIFKNREHLINYVIAKNLLKETLAASEKNNSNAVKSFGRVAFNQLLQASIEQDERQLPFHVQMFSPKYIWVQILSESIASFKDAQENDEAIQFLYALLNHKVLGRNYLGSWYNELVKRLYNRDGNWDAGAELLGNAIVQVSPQGLFNVVDYFDLMCKAEGLVKKQRFISREVKKSLATALNSQGRLPQDAVPKKTITYDSAGDIRRMEKTAALEDFAASSYYNDGLTSCINRGSEFAMTVAMILLWNELFDSPIPGAFVSPYQKAPLDLYSADFITGREALIQKKLDDVRSLSDAQFSIFMASGYERNKIYESEMSKDIFDSVQTLKEIIMCLGKDVILKICEKLVSEFEIWKSGFPELLVWNSLCSQYKFVKVKPKKGQLSTKEDLWLRYLDSREIKTEVCYVCTSG